ncbi:hypothetical protein ABZ557_27225 [Streptomyces sp. NPDC019645]|uniref:hypothetical protein n=1 Tax=Streptomyces sp. NPDC019645 TaxID=3154786 RepID=UPI0033D98277
MERAVDWIANVVNRSTAFSHPSDHDKAVLVLEQLRQRGHTFDVQARPDLVESWEAEIDGG